MRPANLIGCGVDYESSSGTSTHGTITKVRYSLFGEPSVVIRASTPPGEMSTDLMVFGRLAADLISTARSGT